MRALPLTLLLATACATVAPRPAPPGLAKYADAIDWVRAGDEAVSVLSAYLKVDTRNPPGNETAGARFIATALEREGVSSTVHEFAPGRGSLIARLPATGTPEDKPLCLLSHLDVVPADDALWPADAQPLAGAVKDGFVWGRGALDMKGMGALELQTMVWLKRTGVPLRRDVVLLAVADEEAGNRGMKHLVDLRWKDVDCGVVINEGGLGLKDAFTEGQTAFAISVAEKGTLWLRLVARGEAGHGSTPMASRAPSRLVRALDTLGTRVARPSIHPAMYEMLRRAGAQQGGLTGFVMRHPLLVDLLVTDRLMSRPATRAAITNTCQVTGFEGKGSEPNVVPNEVAAIVDCRVLPSTPPDALLSELKELLKYEDGVSLEVLQSQPGSESPWDDPLFDALVRNLTAGRADAVAGPVSSIGYTDSNLVRPMGAKAYGMVPFEIDAELLATMHGRDERVPVAQVRRGLEVLFRSVVEAAARP